MWKNAPVINRLQEFWRDTLRERVLFFFFFWKNHISKSLRLGRCSSICLPQVLVVIFLESFALIHPDDGRMTLEKSGVLSWCVAAIPNLQVLLTFEFEYKIKWFSFVILRVGSEATGTFAAQRWNISRCCKRPFRYCRRTNKTHFGVRFISESCFVNTPGVWR